MDIQRHLPSREEHGHEELTEIQPGQSVGLKQGSEGKWRRNEAKKERA